jgi:hypothetical protein
VFLKLHRLIVALAITLIAAFAACSNTDDGTTPGDTTAPARVTDLSILSAGDSTLTIQWTAPGDDGHTGKAKSYQIRWSHAAITGSNFGSATAVANPPAPVTAGTAQQFTVTGLDTTLATHIALRARDDAGNYSQVSNDAAFSPTGDATPPAKITDLAVVGAGNNSLTLQWTAPGDDGNTGTASSYEVRWSAGAITAGNFASATLAPGAPAPAVAGTVQQFTVTGLDTTLVTHFAMIAKDEVANPSPVSNDAVWSPAVAQHLVKDIPPFKDNSMYEEDGALSNGALPYVFTGRTQGLSGTAVLRRALLAFAVSDSIPAGAVIDSVQLTMHVSKERTSASRATSLHRVTADWGEGTSDSGGAGGGGGTATTNDATWVYRFFNTVTWTTPGGDFNASASATKNITTLGTYTWKSAQMKTDVQGWLDTPANNFGWVMLGDESGTAGTAKRLDSRENPTAANRPTLKVFYTVP